MVEADYYNTHITLYNVDVTISEDGRLYLENPNNPAKQYFVFMTSGISKDKLKTICEEIENNWDKGEDDVESDY